MDDAEALADIDKHEFQAWVCRRLRINEPTKKGADRGIDGRYAGMFDNGDAWNGIVSVKAGKVSVVHLRDLRGTVEREQADLGLLVTLKSPTGPMRREATDAGFTPEGVPRLQILTISELLDERTPLLPEAAARPALDPARTGRRLRTV